MNKKLSIIMAPLLATTFLASCGGKPESYTVTCSSEDVILSNLEVKLDEDYHTTITVKNEKINEGKGYSVPNQLTKVTSGKDEVTNYTYTPTENTFSAELTIPKESIKGNINIELDVKELTSLCFTALENNSSISYIINGDLNGIDIEKSTDGANWTDWDGAAIPLKKDERIFVRNTGGTLSTSESNYFYFDMGEDSKIAVSGNVNSMVNYNRLTNYCFINMFFDCYGLVTAPALPATALASACYMCMFQYCDFLISAPKLPATILTNQCYRGMFAECKALTVAPDLPAMALTWECYRGMFRQCDGLIKAPNLPATTLADRCYYRMFKDCDSLVEAPDILPAVTLADECYLGMFSECEALTKAPELPAFDFGSSHENCYKRMFRYDEKINYIKVGFGNKDDSNFWPEYNTDDWLDEISATGVFVWCGAKEPTFIRSDDTIPEGWTIETY